MCARELYSLPQRESEREKKERSPRAIAAAKAIEAHSEAACTCSFLYARAAACSALPLLQRKYLSSERASALVESVITFCCFPGQEEELVHAYPQMFLESQRKELRFYRLVRRLCRREDIRKREGGFIFEDIKEEIAGGWIKDLGVYSGLKCCCRGVIIKVNCGFNNTEFILCAFFFFYLYTPMLRP